MERDNTIDSLKFILICMVILGHSIPKWGGANSCYLESSIYLFHMPMFVMLSGYFSKKAPFGKFLSTISSLLLSLVVFELLNILLAFFLHDKILPIDRPYWTLWYLLSLIYWRIILQFIPQKWLDKKNWILSCSLVLALITPLLPIGYIASFQRTFSFLPFFMIGYYLKVNEAAYNMRTIRATIPIVIMFFCLLSCSLLLNFGFPVMQVLRGADSYRDFHLPIHYVFSLKIILILLSLAFCLSLFSAFRVSNSWMAKEGRNSLSYYLFHAPLIEYVLVPLTSYLSLDNSTCLLIAICIVNLIICGLLSRFNFLAVLVSPLLYIQKK